MALARKGDFHAAELIRFYERAEVKDALAYLRLVAYRDDDAAPRVGRWYT